MLSAVAERQSVSQAGVALLLKRTQVTTNMPKVALGSGGRHGTRTLCEAIELSTKHA